MPDASQSDAQSKISKGLPASGFGSKKLLKHSLSMNSYMPNTPDAKKDATNKQTRQPTGFQGNSTNPSSPHTGIPQQDTRNNHVNATHHDSQPQSPDVNTTRTFPHTFQRHHSDPDSNQNHLSSYSNGQTTTHTHSDDSALSPDDTDKTPKPNHSSSDQNGNGSSSTKPKPEHPPTPKPESGVKNPHHGNIPEDKPDDSGVYVSPYGSVTEFDEDGNVDNVYYPPNTFQASGGKPIHPGLDDTPDSLTAEEEEQAIKRFFAPKPIDPSPDEQDQSDIIATEDDIYGRTQGLIARTSPYANDMSESLSAEEEELAIKLFLAPRPIDPDDSYGNDYPKELPSEIPDLPVSPTSSHRSGRNYSQRHEQHIDA